MTKKRAVKIAVVSDVHLGTYGCHAKELVKYLKSIQPEILILNGDIIDIWQFSKSYWPKSHMQVVKQLTTMLTKGVKMYYITGNHDEMMRKFVGLKMGNIQIENKVVLKVDGKKHWFFHGDVFDITMQHSKWLAKLGGKGYDMLILLNRGMNFISKKVGKGNISLSKKIKNSVKSAIKFVNDFEKTASDIAISNNYDYVICGHIHQPVIKEISNSHGSVTYLNSGDWVENLTALEFYNKKWHLYEYKEEIHEPEEQVMEEVIEPFDDKQLYKLFMEEIKIISVK